MPPRDVVPEDRRPGSAAPAATVGGAAFSPAESPRAEHRDATSRRRGAEEPRGQVLLVLRALVAGTPLPADTLARPSAELLQSLGREGLLAHLDPAGLPRDEDGESGDGSGLAPAVREASRQAAQRNLFALATLSAASRALARAGIRHLGFKGPVTNAALYGERARRVYGDLDLLVRRADRERAAAALGELGMATSAGPSWWRSPLAALARRGHFHATFGTPPGRGILPIELHWELIDRLNLLRIDVEDLLAAAEEQTVAGVPVPVLDRDAHVVYLCCHLAKHAVFLRRDLRLPTPAVRAVERSTDRGAEHPARGGSEPLTEPLTERLTEPLADRAARPVDCPADWLGGEERGFPLAWLLDLHHSLLLAAERRAAGGTDRVARLVAEWNAGEEVAHCLALLDVVIPSPARSAAVARLGLMPGDVAATTRGVVGSLVASPLGRRAVARGSRFHGSWFFRPIRLLDLPRVLLPSPHRLRAFHRAPQTFLPWLYVRHALVMARRVLAS